MLATQGKLPGRDVIPFRRPDPPADSFLVYGSVWAVLKFLQEHPGWHERGRLLKAAGEQGLSIRQPHADTARLLVRFGWAEQCEEPRKGFARPRRQLRVTERGLRVRFVADRRGRMVMVRLDGEAALRNGVRRERSLNSATIRTSHRGESDANVLGGLSESER